MIREVTALLLREESPEKRGCFFDKREVRSLRSRDFPFPRFLRLNGLKQSYYVAMCVNKVILILFFEE